MSVDEKATWQRYLTERREALISKVEGLSEYEARTPRSPSPSAVSPADPRPTASR